jgi:hypothetical protein
MVLNAERHEPWMSTNDCEGPSVAEELKLSDVLKQAKWKVKIQDKESREPPHVSILRRTDKWRINLRTREFMDKRPDPSEIPQDLLDFLQDNWVWACETWDEMYPDNPVEGEEK